MKKIKDLRKLETNDLRKELIDTSKKIFELKMKLRLNELKQTHLIKPLRRYIAVINMIINEKRI